MTVPTLISAPAAPSTSDTPEQFDAKAYPFVGWLAGLATQLNAWIAAIIPLAAAAYTGASSSSVAIGSGAKSFTATAGRGWIGGQTIRVSDTADAGNYMVGTITSYDSDTGALVVSVTSTGGSGTKSAWDIALELSADLSAKLDVAGGTASDLTVTGYTETPVDPAAGASFSPVLSAGTVFNYDTNANATLTLPTAVAGQSFAVRLTYGGAHTLTFAGETVEWADGAAPDPTSTTGAVDVYAFSCFEAGIWTGFDGGRDIS